MKVCFLFLFLLHACSCEIFGIGDARYPYLYLSNPVAPVIWNSNVFSIKMGSCSAVRVNSRGIQFIPSSSLLSVRAGDSSQWGAISCTRDPSKSALCSMDFGGNVTGDVFPGPESSVFVSASHVPDEVPAFISVPCTESSTGRSLEINPSVDVWDISACNVIGAGMDFIYIPSDSVLYVMHDPISVQMFFLMSITSLGMAIVLAHNLEFSMGSSDKRVSAPICVSLMLLSLVCTCFATARISLDWLVTGEDKITFLFCIFYVLYYNIKICMDYIFFKGDASMGSPVNPIIISIFMVVMRFYCTADNGYTSILAFLLLIRLIHKLGRLFIGNAEFSVVWVCSDCIFDAGALSFMLFVGILNQYNCDFGMLSIMVLQAAMGAGAVSRYVLAKQGCDGL